MLNSIAGKTYGTVSAEIQKEMTGPEFVRGLVDGTLPLNTIAEALGYDVTEVGRGRVVVIAKPNGTHLNPTGTVHGGLSATLRQLHGPRNPLDAGKGRGLDHPRIQDFAVATNHPRKLVSSRQKAASSIAAAVSEPRKGGSPIWTDGCSSMARQRA
ncbi:MAG: PaaI family thioesterase [Xanthobacteraceae bacterium]